MKYGILLMCFFAIVAIYEVSGQIHCYSCSSNLGSSYGRRNYDCVSNLTNVRTVRCSRGYYCLTSYTVQEGSVTFIRRACQNPRSDHNQNTDSPPTEDGCTSSHSRYSSPNSATCYFHCTTDRCNKDSPKSIKQCPDSCPNNCNLLTGDCSTILSCVQCTSDSDDNCETKTAATACPRSTYNYCASTRTSVLNLRQQVVHTAVTKTCTTFSNSYDVPNNPCKFRTNNRGRNRNEFIKYTCAEFCASNGCNQKIPGSTPDEPTGSRLRCVVCSQIGTSGSCTRATRTSPCPAAATHCEASVSYYVSPVETSNGNPTYQLAEVKRSCATKEVTKQCISNKIPNSNLQSVTCQESCTTNGCNTGWPARPKCSQCDATNRTYSSRQFENCRTSPFAPRQCSSPLYQFCTTISNNTASDPDVPRSVKRGCSITDIGTTCYDLPGSSGGTINHCQSACAEDGCNRKAVL